MTKIVVHHEVGPAAPRTAERHPWRWLRNVLTGDRPPTFRPAYEVKETEAAYLLEADLPGVKENGLEVRLLRNRLWISGQRDVGGDGTCLRRERDYGRFARTFHLPPSVDGEHVTAKLENGVLTLELPKKRL